MKEVEHEFPLYLAKPAQRALASQGISILGDLSKFTKSEIKELHGIGPNAFKKMQEDMWEHQISFRKGKWVEQSARKTRADRNKELIKIFDSIALSFPETESAPHFDRTAFKVVGKRIFATLDKRQQSVNIKLSPSEQRQFCEHYSDAVAPVPNKWGKQGWTTFDLKSASEELLKAALEMAYNEVVGT